MTGKTIIFHSLDHARAARAVSGSGAAFTLQTAPGAAIYAGVGYLKALIEKAGADKAGIEALIDCGADAGIALAALRTGWKRVVFSGDGKVFAKLAQIAARQGAEIAKPNPDGATLNLLDAPDPFTACRDFLGSNQA